MIRILAISGSLRARSSNTAILRAFTGLVPPHVEVELEASLAALPHFNPDLDGEGAIPPATVAAFRTRLAAADGVVICSPEYAHGVPGALKNALDWLVSVSGLAGKPAVVIGASPSGGEWAYAQLTEILSTMAWRVLTESSLRVQFSQGLLSPSGEVSDPALLAALRKSVDDLLDAI
jgi:chromate reductase